MSIGRKAGLVALIILSALLMWVSIADAKKNIEMEEKEKAEYNSFRSHYSGGHSSTYKKPSTDTYKPSTSTGTYKPSYSSSGSSSKNNGWESYDDGYDDIYENDDYDEDRYNRDPEYAAGVDDAMDELDW